MKKKKTIGKLVVFGTLLKGKMGTVKDIWVLLGKKKEVLKIDKEYQKRKFIGPWGLEEVAKLYRGFSEDELKEVTFYYCRHNLIEGAREFMVELKKREFLIGAISSNPQFVMDMLAKILPLDFSEGTRLEFKEKVVTGNILKKVDRYSKAEVLKEKRKKYKLRKKQVIIIGDSITSFPMINEAKVFIDFDIRKETIKDIAGIITTHGEFKEIF